MADCIDDSILCNALFNRPNSYVFNNGLYEKFNLYVPFDAFLLALKRFTDSQSCVVANIYVPPVSFTDRNNLAEEYQKCDPDMAVLDVNERDFIDRKKFSNSTSDNLENLVAQLLSKDLGHLGLNVHVRGFFYDCIGASLLIPSDMIDVLSNFHGNNFDPVSGAVATKLFKRGYYTSAIFSFGESCEGNAHFRSAEGKHILPEFHRQIKV